MFTLDHTVRAYSGRRGCMCGCLGNYTETPRARLMAIRALSKNPEARVESFGSVDNRGVAGCIYLQTPTRIRAVYLTAEGLEAARAALPDQAD